MVRLINTVEYIGGFDERGESDRHRNWKHRQIAPNFWITKKFGAVYFPESSVN
jgi:hypothetical protein